MTPTHTHTLPHSLICIIILVNYISALYVVMNYHALRPLRRLIKSWILLKCSCDVMCCGADIGCCFPPKVTTPPILIKQTKLSLKLVGNDTPGMSLVMRGMVRAHYEGAGTCDLACKYSWCYFGRRRSCQGVEIYCTPPGSIALLKPAKECTPSVILEYVMTR